MNPEVQTRICNRAGTMMRDTAAPAEWRGSAMPARLQVWVSVVVAY